MAPVSDERLSTKDLLDELKNAIRLNPDADIQHPKAKSAVVSGQYSDILQQLSYGYKEQQRAHAKHKLHREQAQSRKRISIIVPDKRVLKPTIPRYRSFRTHNY